MAASQWVVTTTSDPLLSQTACPAANGMPCSLRAAVSAANSAGGTNLITFAPGLTGTFPVTAASGGQLLSTSDQTIQGSGASATVIDAMGENHAIFFAQKSLTLQGVTLQRAHVVATGSQYAAGAALSGGGGPIALIDSVVTDNSVSAEADAVGGGMLIQGPLTLTRTRVVGNSATSSGHAAYGGGVVVQGAIGDGASPVTITQSQISGNSVIGTGVGSATRHIIGGGLVVDRGVQPFSLDGTTIDDNHAIDQTSCCTGTEAGGADIANQSGGSFSVTNSTIAGNSVEGTNSLGGGGLEVASFTANRTVDLVNDTIADNSSSSGGSQLFAAAGQVRVRASIVRGASENCSLGTQPNIAASITSLGGNVDSGSTCQFTGPWDQSNTDPGLGGLMDNGGTTMTRALSPRSPAVDAVPANLCPPPTTDQRGVSRPQGPACDAGAFEGQQSPPGPPPAPGPAPPAGGTSLYGALLNGGGSGTTELHALSQQSHYTQFMLHAATAFGSSDPIDWQFFVAPVGGDGQPDLIGVHERGTASGHVEVHALSAASGYRSWILHTATPLAAVPRGTFEFTVGSLDGDHRSDLFAVALNGTASGTVEVHALNDASGYNTWVLHSASALAAARADQWQFRVGDRGGRGDLVGIRHSTTGSGKTEVHVLSRASGYQGFLVHMATPLGTTSDNRFAFALGDHDADGVPDVYAVAMNGTASGRTEVHVLSGATNFSQWIEHAVTALAATSPSRWEFSTR